MKLSIIIPYYNAEPYTRELLACLDKQMDPEVEVILIDDGSDDPFKADYAWLKIKRKRNGGASSARNKGLDMAKGDYVAFIDADDLVADNYIKSILSKIDSEKFDYCYMSWKTMPGGWNCIVKLKSVNDKFPDFNLCVWNRVYKRSMIGDVRFNTKKAVAEDAQFIREVREQGKKKAFIADFMYFYRSGCQDSLTARIGDGRLEMNRIVYHIPHVTKDMTHLIKEFTEADKESEVILMTYNNEIPELAEHAMVMNPPQHIKGTELRGEPTPLFSLIERPEHFQVIIWTARTFYIGGIETFNYNFCKQMREYYDILVLYDEIDSVQLARLAELVECRKNNPKKVLLCDTIIINRITDDVPDNVRCKQKIQMVHACKMDPNWNVPEADEIITVSETVAKTFDLKKYTVINNMTAPKEVKKPLILVSATRTKTFEKGQRRMVDFARLLEKKNIPYIWLCFTDGGIKGATENMVLLKPTLNIMPYIKAADYLVQLSNAEGFCYSIVEALEVGTPVIVTPLDVLPEIGFEDMINGYMVPFEITEEIDFDMIVNRRLKGFKYEYDNQSRVEQWKRILGKKKPKRKYRPEKMPKCRITKSYFDMEFNRKMVPGEIVRMSNIRAKKIHDAGFCVFIEG